MDGSDDRDNLDSDRDVPFIRWKTSAATSSTYKATFSSGPKKRLPLLKFCLSRRFKNKPNILFTFLPQWSVCNASVTPTFIWPAKESFSYSHSWLSQLPNCVCILTALPNFIFLWYAPFQMNYLNYCDKSTIYCNKFYDKVSPTVPQRIFYKRFLWNTCTLRQ